MTDFIVDVSIEVYSQKHPLQQQFKEYLVFNLIAACGIPISVVENPEFKRFIKDCNPKLVVPCRQSLTYKVLPRLTDSTRVVLMKRLEKADHVALAMDIWTDRSMHSCLAITAHAFVNCTPLWFVDICLIHGITHRSALR